MFTDCCGDNHGSTYCKQTMTTSLLEHGLNAKQILRLLFRKFRDLCNLRCISIIGLAFLIVQLLLLILYGHTRCEGEICVTESRNTSSFYSIFFWNWRKKGPLLPLCPTIPPGLCKYSKIIQKHDIQHVQRRDQ